MRSNACLLLAFATVLPLSAAEPVQGPGLPILGDAPTAPTGSGTLPRGAGRGLASVGGVGGYRVDVANRAEVRNFYNTVYVASEGVAMGWTGAHAGCDPGTTAPVFREAVLRRINYFRAMAGVPADVTLNDAFNVKAQEAALIMSAQGGLSHGPPPDWACYTAVGAEAAANSNLALGSQGPAAIDGYMQDHGLGNEAVGHRRWLVYPQTRIMGTGDVAAHETRMAANATWVFDGNFGGTRPATREAYVAWPPPGYVPYSQVYTRWSFGHPDADFGSASVTLSSNTIPVEVRLEPLVNGVGEPTLVWYVNGSNPEDPGASPKPAGDVEYSVVIRGVRLRGASVDLGYTVRAFDPAEPGPGEVLPAITGPSAPAVGVATRYTFDAVPGAEGYDWRQARREVGELVEGAEANQTGFTAQTSGGYDVVVRAPVAAGSFAYHLAHPNPPGLQALVYPTVFRVVPDSEIRFRSRLGWATELQRASVQISLNEGKTWVEVYGQPGTDGQGETGFQARVAALGAYAGRTVQVRFVYDYQGPGSYFPQTTEGVGWHLDEIEFRNLDRLVQVTAPEATAGAAFDFVAPGAADYLLQARARVFGGFGLDWGPALPVSASGSAPSTLAWVGVPRFSGSRVVMEFRVTGGVAPTRYELLRADGEAWDWMPAVGAQLEELVPGRDYRFTVEAGASPRGFYRVRGF